MKYAKQIVNRRQKRCERNNARSKRKKKINRIQKSRGKNAVYQLFMTINHFFPDLFLHMRELEDCREKSDYELAELITACIAMSMFMQGSRNALNNAAEEGEFKENYEKLFKMRIPHMDTVDNVMRRLKEDQLERLKTRMIQTLLKNKTLHKYRFMKKWHVVAIDATGVMTFDEKHCDQCLHKTSKNGKTTYFHNVLEAKLITPNGFSISLATEWIENPYGEYDKQDCEQKAFKRLAAKLKDFYPKLPVCITADGLYPNQTFFNICKENKWAFIVTFEDGNLPTVWEEIGELRKIVRNNTDTKKRIEGKKTILQDYCWINGVDYKGYFINWIECCESVTDAEGETKGKKFVHITDLEIDRAIAGKISQTGRLRWKIENEGFNIQKNHGYALQHKYSRVSYLAAKNYYQCLQMGHIINQLLILSDNFKENMERKTTIKHLWMLLIGFLIYCHIDSSELSTHLNRKIQIRFT